MSRVVLTDCHDYDQRRVDSAVAELMSRLDPLDLKPGERVLLKPNCLSESHGPAEPVNTRAEVVLAVGRYLKERYRVQLGIADSGGMGSYGRTKQAYELMGLDRVAEALGGELINLEEHGLMEIACPQGRIVTSFMATEVLDGFEAIVNLPKFKTHLQAGLTGAVKNPLGLLPGSLKRDIHVRAPSNREMAQALVDIMAGFTARFRIVLHLMDAVVGMEGQGPARGKPRQVGRLIGSTDPVALDTVMAAIMGLGPESVGTVSLGAEAGLGVADQGRIELIGGEWQKLRLPKYKKASPGPQLRLAQVLPRSIAGPLFYWLEESVPRTVNRNCRKCGLCVKACPANALSLSEKGIALDASACIECYCCLEHCGSEALFVPANLWEKIRGPR